MNSLGSPVNGIGIGQYIGTEGYTIRRILLIIATTITDHRFNS